MKIQALKFNGGTAPPRGSNIFIFESRLGRWVVERRPSLWSVGSMHANGSHPHSASGLWSRSVNSVIFRKPLALILLGVIFWSTSFAIWGLNWSCLAKLCLVTLKLYSYVRMSATGANQTFSCSRQVEHGRLLSHHAPQNVISMMQEKKRVPV